MALVLRSTKGSALTHTELDANFSGLASGSLITPTPVSWTPVLTFTTPGNLAVAYSTQSGDVTKTGISVRANFTIVTSSFVHTTASGSLQVTGLPYTSASDSLTCDGAMLWGGITKANFTSMVCSLAASSATFVFGICGSGQSPQIVSATDMPSGGSVVLRATVTFRTAA